MAIYKDVEPLEVVTYKGENEDFDRGVQFILEKLDALPTADVVEVVLCGECKYYDCGRCYKHNIWIGDLNFCSYGEKRATTEGIKK